MDSCPPSPASRTPWSCSLSMGFFRQEDCTGWPFPSPGDLPDPGIKPRSPALRADSLPYEAPGNSDPGVILQKQFLTKISKWPLKAKKAMSKAYHQILPRWISVSQRSAKNLSFLHVYF